MSEKTVMSPERRKRIIIRYTALFMTLTAAFWGIWSIFAPVPEVQELVRDFVTDAVITLPFAVSHWWDVLFAGIWVAGIAWAVTHPGAEKDEDLLFGLIFSLAFGFFLGFIFGLGFGLVVGLVVGSLAAGLLIGLFSDFPAGLALSLVVGLGAGLGFGLAFGLAVGLAFGLAVGLAVGLRTLYAAGFWRHAANWLNAKDGIPTLAMEAEPSVPEASPLEARYAEAVEHEKWIRTSLDAATAERERLEADLGGTTQGAKVIAITAERL